MKKIISYLLISFTLSISVFSQEKQNFLNKKPLSEYINEKSEKEKKLSVSKAFLMSLILPGWGEHYTDKKGISDYLIAAEVTLWLTFIGMHKYANWLEEDYKAFAAEHAGINNTGKGSKYYVNIGNFMNIYEYNTKKRFDREDNLVYDEKSDYFWQWDTDENRQKFDKKRIKSDRIKNRTIFVASAILLNHFISGLNASFGAKKINQRNISMNFSVENIYFPICWANLRFYFN